VGQGIATIVHPTKPNARTEQYFLNRILGPADKKLNRGDLMVQMNTGYKSLLTPEFCEKFGCEHPLEYLSKLLADTQTNDIRKHVAIYSIHHIGFQPSTLTDTLEHCNYVLRSRYGMTATMDDLSIVVHSGVTMGLFIEEPAEPVLCKGDE
jgi:hypothetical protein